MPTASEPGAPERVRSPRGIAIRLGFTCWLLYSLHFATNMVRENYLALAIGDDFTFRVDAYANLHDDIFETPDHGWHIGSNPGASMLGAIPYALSRPILDRIVYAVQRARASSGLTAPPFYDAPTPKDQRFYEEAWRRGLDVKFGLASFVMQSLAMAVVSALGVVAMYVVLLGMPLPSAAALGLALLYAFGTPVFFRTGFLNHNLMLAHVGLAGFAVLGAWPLRLQLGTRFALAGLAGGFALLLDYSGIIFLAGLLACGFARHRNLLTPMRLRLSGFYALGALVPVLLLWFYQWRSFGHAFLPPQHWMPPVEWSDQGYQGLALPQANLAVALAFDYRYGLFVSCPLFLFAFALPFLDRRPSSLPRADVILCFAFAFAFFLFFSSVHYTRWQFNTGVRYLAPVFPFLFLPAAMVLQRMPVLARRLTGTASVALAWCMAMARDVSGGKVDLADPDTGLGVLDPVLAVVANGFQLPALTTLSRMQAYAEPIGAAVSPLPLMLLAAAILYVVWKPPAASSVTAKDASGATAALGNEP